MKSVLISSWLMVLILASEEKSAKKRDRSGFSQRGLRRDDTSDQLERKEAIAFPAYDDDDDEFSKHVGGRGM